MLFQCLADEQHEICSTSSSMNEEAELGTTEGWLNVSLANETFYDCENFPQGILEAAWFRVVLYILYTGVFFIALLGNVLVCYVVYKAPKSKHNNLTNYFIVNLAVGDILIDLFCVPTSFISTLMLQHWPFKHELCPIVNFSQAVSVLVSGYTLVVISIDRYIAIMYLFRPRGGKLYAKLSIFVVWLLAIIISFPILVVSGVKQPHEIYKACGLYVCQEDWSNPKQKYYYTIALLILQYLVPLLILMFNYISIAIMVWGKRPPGEAENNRDQRMTRSKKKERQRIVKMIKMMMAVVIVFTICWLPFNVLNMIMDYNQGIHSWSGLPYVWATLHWLSMSHACYNPVIYCWMSTTFRQGFYNALRWVPLVGRFVPDRSHAYNTSVGGIPLTGMGKSMDKSDENLSIITNDSS